MSENHPRPLWLKFKYTDLVLSEKRCEELEKLAEGIADLADSLGYLDPLDTEPALVFDPRVECGCPR